MPDVDPVDLTARLVRCPSVTPEDAGAIDILRGELNGAGFETHRADRNGISNLFARWGPKGHPRSFGFNGHTDVVPVGDPSAWSVDPFGAVTRDGLMIARGACDMKSARFKGIFLLVCFRNCIFLSSSRKKVRFVSVR